MKMEKEINNDNTEKSEEYKEYLELSKARSPLTERVIYEMSHNLFNKTKIRMITRLSNLQIDEFSKAMLVNELFIKRYIPPESELGNVMDNIFDRIMELMISKDGKGREDITQMVGGMNMIIAMDKKGKIMGR